MRTELLPCAGDTMIDVLSTTYIAGEIFAAKFSSESEGNKRPSKNHDSGCGYGQNTLYDGFGFDLDEVDRLGDLIGGKDAIVKVTVPKSTVKSLDLTPLDSAILKSGSATANKGPQLDLVNKTLKNIQRVD